MRNGNINIIIALQCKKKYNKDIIDKLGGSDMENEGKVKRKILFEPSKYWKSYLLIGIVSWELLPFLFQTLVFVGQKDALSAVQTLGMDVVAKIISIFFVGLFLVYYMKNEKNRNTEKERYIRLWKDAMGIIVCVTYMKYIPIMILQYGSLYYPKISVVVCIALFVLGIVIFLVSVLFAAMDMQPILWNRKKDIFNCIKKKKGILLATIGILIWSLTGDYILLKLTTGLIVLMKGGYSLQLTSVLVHGIVHGIAYVSYFSYVRESMENIVGFEAVESPENTDEEDAKTEEDNGISPKQYKSGRKWSISDIAATVVTIMIVGVWIANSYIGLKANKREDVQAYIADVISKAGEELEHGNKDEANRLYVKAEEYMNALDFYIGTNAYELKKLIQANPSDDFYWQLYYAYTQDIELLKQRIIKQPHNIGLYHELLSVYAKYEESEEGKSIPENEEEISWRNLCIQKCLDAGRFQADYVCIDRDSLEEANITELHNQYDDELAYNELMTELRDSDMKGGVNRNSLKRIIDMADANEENMIFQLTAIEYGAEYVKTDRAYYSWLSKLMKRYDNLYSKANPTDEELLREKLHLTEIMVENSDYESALEILQPVELKGNEEIEKYIILCYEGLGQQEQLAKYMETLIEMGNPSATEYYYAALSNLKMKNVDKSLSYGVNLADTVIKASGEEKESNNKLLNSYVQYLCINDSRKKYVQYKYSVSGFSEKQVDIIEKSPLLKAYIEATGYFYNDMDYEKAKTAVERIDELCPNMSMTWLLRGNIYYDLGDFDKAIESYENCLQIDPNNLSAEYSMLTLYETLQEYEKAYELCERILEKTKHVKIEEDWYGIIYYTELLKEKLIPYVTGETS